MEPASELRHYGTISSVASIEVEESVPLVATGDNTSDNKGNVVIPERHMGLFSGVTLIVGQIIGSGIFASPGPVLVETGSLGMSLVTWLVAGVVSMAGAYCYAELGTMIPASGGEYQYLLQAFGPLAGFTYSWTMVMFGNSIAIAAIAQVFSLYACNIAVGFSNVASTDPLTTTDWTVKIVAAVTIMLVVCVNCLQRGSGNAVQNIFTMAKLGAIVLIVMIGAYWLITGNVDEFRHPFEGTTANPAQYGTAIYFALFSYIGWNNLNYAAGELKNPRRNLPLAITISLVLVIACYVLTNLAYFAVLPLEMIRQSNTVAMEFGMATMGPFGKYLMAVMVTISAFGAINGGTIVGSRVAVASAGDSSIFPKTLAHIHATRGTPVRALFFVGTVTSFWALIGDFASLVDILMCIIWFCYFITIVGLLRLRVLYPDAPRPFRVWTPLAVMFCIVAGSLAITPLFNMAKNAWLYSFSFLGCMMAIPIYWFKVQPPKWALFRTQRNL
ncbi:amino acid/polyamine transporter I [Syncephalis fuscata]|nr:amino acid/polyamine transporter I [Syncephalis fuscata]